ncbi:WYL domain-containing protein [Pectobacterium polonicum]|uniref:helix-turn-helix transcriptional regulator n=1 Tax=Pectobacterium polonicum TaxID=2485124 RepID=UPI003754712E
MSEPKDRLFRHLALLRLIPREPKSISTAELLQKLKDREFDIDLRTLQRDLVGRIGVDFPLLCDESQRPYQWSFPKEMPQFDFPALDISTALAFVFAESYLEKLLPPGVLQHLWPHFGMAHKQLQGLEHNNLTRWAERVRALPNGKTLLPAEIDDAVWEKVATALMQKNKLQISYLSRSKGEPKQLCIQPLGVIARHSISYVVGVVDGYSDLRQFALQRILQAHVLNEPVDRYDDFNIDDYIASGAFTSGHSEPLVELIADIHPQIAWLLRETPLSHAQRLEPLPNSDWLRLHANITPDRETLWWILGLNDNIRVYQPSEWVKAIREKVQRMVQMYK